MGKLWKVGQLGTRLLAGGAGFALGGPAGAAIGASTVGPMISDALFPQPEKDKEIFSWTEPDPFQAYESKPDSRLGVTEVKQQEGQDFMGALKTADAIGSTIGSFLPGGGLLGKAANKVAEAGAKTAVEGTGSTFGNLVKKKTVSLADTGFNGINMEGSGMRGGLYGNVVLQGLLTKKW
jgi:hypothetical protein